jgi:hypothetical protein
MIIKQTSKMTTKQLMHMLGTYDSCPRKGGAGQCEICIPTQKICNLTLWTIYFWNFQVHIFRLWLAPGSWIFTWRESWQHCYREYICLSSPAGFEILGKETAWLTIIPGAMSALWANIWERAKKKREKLDHLYLLGYTEGMEKQPECSPSNVIDINLLYALHNKWLRLWKYLSLTPALIPPSSKIHTPVSSHLLHRVATSKELNLKSLTDIRDLKWTSGHSQSSLISARVSSFNFLYLQDKDLFNLTNFSPERNTLMFPPTNSKVITWIFKKNTSSYSSQEFWPLFRQVSLIFWKSILFSALS